MAKQVRLKKMKTDEVKTSELSTSLYKAFVTFLERHPAKRFNKNIRRMLMENLMQEGAAESDHLYETLVDFQRIV